MASNSAGGAKPHVCHAPCHISVLGSSVPTADSEDLSESGYVLLTCMRAFDAVHYGRISGLGLGLLYTFVLAYSKTLEDMMCPTVGLQAHDVAH